MLAQKSISLADVGVVDLEGVCIDLVGDDVFDLSVSLFLTERIHTTNSKENIPSHLFYLYFNRDG